MIWLALIAGIVIGFILAALINETAAGAEDAMRELPTLKGHEHRREMK